MHRCFQLHKGLRSRGSIKAAHAQGNPAGILHTDSDAGAQRGQKVSVVVVHAGTKVAPAREVQMQLWLLRQEGGASLTEIAQATGWLPHSTRAALTGLRMKGHAIESRRIGKLTTYVLA